MLEDFSVSMYRCLTVQLVISVREKTETRIEKFVAYDNISQLIHQIRGELFELKKKELRNQRIFSKNQLPFFFSTRMSHIRENIFEENFYPSTG